MAWRHKIDWYLLGSVIFLLFFGVLMVYNASSVSALRDFGDKFYFLKEQIKWVILGLLALGFFTFFDYRLLYKFSPLILIIAILGLVLVFVPGLGMKASGAHRWINLGVAILQPSEFAKLALIIYLSAWFASKEKGRLLAFGLLLGVFVGLILLEPDMGTAVILGAVAIVLYFLSGAPFWHFLSFAPLVLFCVFALTKIAPYRAKRLTTFLDPASDPLGASYHLRQILISLGSGGLFGVGLGASRQKYSYLPESTTDSIFAVIGEELGFFGSTILIFIFIFIFIRGFKVAFLAKDQFGKLLAVGLSSWLAVQTLVNLGSMTSLNPLTGVPLPFISYGGSALISEMIGVGILLNIRKQNI